MALAPLARTADLDARGIAGVDDARATALLASASEAVREAAGDIIGPRVTSSVTLVGSSSSWLLLPMCSVSAVSAVEIDGVDAGPVRLADGRVWRLSGWRSGAVGPSLVTMDVTHGLAQVPADIVDLVCSLVAGGIVAAEDGYDPKRGVLNERIDDYGRGFATGNNEIISPMDLPDRTRAWLRGRFAGQVAVTGSYS